MIFAATIQDGEVFRSSGLAGRNLVDRDWYRAALERGGFVDHPGQPRLACRPLARRRW